MCSWLSAPVLTHQLPVNGRYSTSTKVRGIFSRKQRVFHGTSMMSAEAGKHIKMWWADKLTDRRGEWYLWVSLLVHYITGLKMTGVQTNDHYIHSPMLYQLRSYNFDLIQNQKNNVLNKGVQNKRRIIKIYFSYVQTTKQSSYL